MKRMQKYGDYQGVQAFFEKNSIPYVRDCARHFQDAGTPMAGRVATYGQVISQGGDSYVAGREQGCPHRLAATPSPLATQKNATCCLAAVPISCLYPRLMNRCQREFMRDSERVGEGGVMGGKDEEAMVVFQCVLE